MTAQTNSVASAQPGNTYLNGIWWDTRWVTNNNLSGPTVITYAPSATYAPNAAEIAAYNQVFADISSICNITFVLGNASTADLVLNAGTGAQMAAVMGIDANSLGVANPPGTNFNGGDEQSFVFNNRDQYSVNGLNKGGYDYITWLHEIGHALGLAHPHDDGGNSTIFPGVTGAFGSLGVDSLNQGIYTTMSYNDSWYQYTSVGGYPRAYGFQATMMAFDVAALQLKYGANFNHATGDNFYVLTDTIGVGSFASCIWDAGGSDWMYYGGAGGASIDLRAATLGTGVGAGGFISYAFANTFAPFTIANGVTIENAIGGNGTDVIIGNAVGNQIYSLGGADFIYGLDGADTIGTDAGADTIYGGGGNDVVLGGADGDTVFLEGDNDLVYGGAGNDVMYGGDGFDQFFGNEGVDTFIGGAGTDYFYMALDTQNTAFDYIYDLTPGTDFIFFQSSQQQYMFYYISGGSAFCYVGLTSGGYSVFGAPNLTAAQLQSAVILY